MQRNIIRIYIGIICIPIIALICGFFFKNMENDAQTVSVAAESSRKLPIYSVELVSGEDGTYTPEDLSNTPEVNQEKKIALSFDAAWGAEDFMKIMEVLDRHNIKVTFFMTGGWVEEYPECVKLLAQKGHDLGNHSEHHYDMSGLTKEEQRKELMDVHNKVKELTGVEMELFRPPYGAYDDTVIDTVSSCGYYAIQWSVDSLDWKNYGVDSIIQTVCNHKDLGPGAIILCHNGAKYTAQALDQMITNLENDGYTFVKISDLILKDNYYIDVTGRQHTK